MRMRLGCPQSAFPAPVSVEERAGAPLRKASSGIGRVAGGTPVYTSGPKSGNAASLPTRHATCGRRSCMPWATACKTCRNVNGTGRAVPKEKLWPFGNTWSA